ncbi:MAG: TniQ family protein [Flexilinea sp.]|nr:TniQ family protein [Flexilinea sp.]
MPNLNKPELMENELLYSYLVRLAEWNSLTIDALGRYFILDGDPEIPARKKIVLPIGSMVFIPKAADILGMSPLDLFLKTTVYPGIAPLQLPGKQVRVINCAFRKDSYRYPNLIGHPQSDVEILKYCPVCRDEDIHGFGYSWLRREHHLPHVNACRRHGIRLVPLKHDSLHPENRLILPSVKPEAADDIDIEYARFASDFLDSRFDLNRILSRRLILQNLCKSSFMHGIEQILRKSPDTFFSEIRKGRKQIEDWKILAGLFTVFHDVSNIPEMPDNDRSDLFYSSIDGYELLSKYSGICVEMRKSDEDEPFVVSPNGFISGWRSPSEDPVSEQEKFIQLFRNSENGEFDPVDNLNCAADSIRFIHKKCGQMITAKPKNIIESGLRCPCQEKSVLNMNFTRERVEISGNYELLSIDEKRILTIRSLKCGHIFDVGYDAWCKLPECRICSRERMKSAQFRYLSAGDDMLYDPQNSFEREVYAVSGEDYEVVGKYRNANTPIGILHKKCGRIKEYVPVHFLHGSRCECEKALIPNGAEFKDYVRCRSCGLYEITGMDTVKRYMIRNTSTGEIKAMDKAYIVQELERPTPSSVLPVPVKGVYGDPFSARLSKVMAAISTDYGDGQLFEIKDLQSIGLSGRKLIPVIRALRKDGFIEKLKGTSAKYRFAGEKA